VALKICNLSATQRSGVLLTGNRHLNCGIMAGQRVQWQAAGNRSKFRKPQPGEEAATAVISCKRPRDHPCLLFELTGESCSRATSYRIPVGRPHRQRDTRWCSCFPFPARSRVTSLLAVSAL